MNLIPQKKDSIVSSAEKRAFERIPASIDARFFYGNIFYSGTVLNVSEKGMFINTKRCLPPDSMFVVIIRESNFLLKVIAKVKRFEMYDSSCNGMGVELMSPSNDYVKFINRINF